ncbi:MAG: 50S ribosomal protein L33 [Myxococcota bacterium]
MAPRGDTRQTVVLACTVCKARNYRTTKKRGQQLVMKKFCKHCGRHTEHRESK